MGAQRSKESQADSDTRAGISALSVNEVHLVGRLSAPAESRTLPSDAVMCTFMVVVDRSESDLTTRQRVDVLNCVVWKPRLRRQAATWAEGDVVELRGAIRKRFFRTAGGATGSRVEVEVASARRIRRVTAWRHAEAERASADNGL
jgi:single-strand DNA-binding protein